MKRIILGLLLCVNTSWGALNTRTMTPTLTPTFTRTMSLTFTPTVTPTMTLTFTNTFTRTLTLTPTYTFTPLGYAGGPASEDTLRKLLLAAGTPGGYNQLTKTPTATPTNTFNSTLLTQSPTPQLTATWTPWVPITGSQSVLSQTPTPINSPVSGQITDFILDAANNSGTSGGNFGLTMNGVVVASGYLAPAGGQSHSRIYYGNGGSTFGLLPPSQAGATINYNYRLFVHGVGTPAPMLR